MLSWILVLVSVCLSHVFEKVQRQNSPQLICDLGSISLALSQVCSSQGRNFVSWAGTPNGKKRYAAVTSA